MSRPALNDFTDLLWCPACRGSLRLTVDPDAGDGLSCDRCGHWVPVVDGIARFVPVLKDEEARRTQASFGYEWTHFSDWRQSGETNFRDYFAGIDLDTLHGRTVLDAGCGMGRHARQVASFSGRVLALDFSQAIDQAARNTRERGNVACIQADLLDLPLADQSFDLTYSLGVLHHLADTERALMELVRTLKPGGQLRIYLYWKRHGWSGRLLALVTLARKVTTRLPFPVLKGLCLGLSALLYGGVVIQYKLLVRLGATRHRSWPLFVYATYPFNVLYNDQFDRFSAPIEKRYDAHEVERLLRAMGLERVSVRACYGWVADGFRPA